MICSFTPKICTFSNRFRNSENVHIWNLHIFHTFSGEEGSGMGLGEYRCSIRSRDYSFYGETWSNWSIKSGDEDGVSEETIDNVHGGI